MFTGVLMRSPAARTISYLLLCVTVGYRSSEAQDTSSTSIGLDHVILYTGVLRQGMAEFARLTGVTPTFGGQHPGRGTQNALVSLGKGRYLELLAPVVDSSSAGSLRLVDWAIHTDQLDGLVGLLRAHGLKPSAPIPGSRMLPDGSTLKWATAAMAGSEYTVAPFFIQWDSSGVHPSASSPTGCTLYRFTVTDIPPHRTIDLLRTLGIDIAVERGARPRLTLVLQCPKGRITFASD